MTAPAARDVDLFGVELVPVNNPRSLIVNNAVDGIVNSRSTLLPASLRPAFAKPLTDDELHELHCIWLRSVSQLPALPRPLIPEKPLVNLPAKLLARFPADGQPAESTLARLLPLPVDPNRETGAETFPVNNLRPKVGVERSGVASKHVSVITQTELQRDGKSKDIRHLRHAVKYSTRALFSRKSAQRKCGRTRFAPGVEARVRDVTDADGKRQQFGYVGGLVRCGSVWSCVCCAPVISSARARIVRAVVEAHREKVGASADGDSCIMGTFTVRHTADMPLPALRRSGAAAWKRFQQSDWARVKRRMGFVGSIKAVECTCGGNGYHWHLHVLFCVAVPLSPVEIAEFESEFYDRWCAALRNVSELSGLMPSREHGVKLTPCHDADYIQKLGLAAELIGGAGKKARGENRTAFQVAVDYHHTHDGHDANIFRRFARGMKGARQLTWSRGKQGANDLRVIYGDAIRALDVTDDQPSLTGLESDAEIMAREEKSGALVASLAGRQWDALDRVMRSAGEDTEHVLRTAVEREGAHGADALLGLAYSLGKQMMATKPHLKKWLRWLAPPDPLPAT